MDVSPFLFGSQKTSLLSYWELLDLVSALMLRLQKLFFSSNLTTEYMPKEIIYFFMIILIVLMIFHCN